MNSMNLKTVVQIPRDSSVLVIEDNVERIDWFKRMLTGVKQQTFAASPSKALNVVGAHRYDVVFLDHDAGWELVTDFNNQETMAQSTFWKAAEALANMNYSGTVIIHSMNRAGAARMEYLLGREAKASRLVFGTFDIEVT
jgi:CheY-like chemotaxis protein